MCNNRIQRDNQLMGTRNQLIIRNYPDGNPGYKRGLLRKFDGTNSQEVRDTVFSTIKKSIVKLFFAVLSCKKFLHL